MNVPEPNAQLDAKHRVMVILWVALVSALGFYYLLSLFVPGPETENDQVPMVTLVLTAVGISLLVISLVVKARFIKQAEEKQTPALVQTGLIVSLALCEAIGLLGLLDHFLTGNRYYFVMFIIAVIGMLFHFPRRSQLALASYRKIGPN
jgi:amino acid transporter